METRLKSRFLLRWVISLMCAVWSLPAVGFSQGLTVGVGSTVSVSNGTLTVFNDIRIDGAMAVTNGRINVGDSWIKDGVFDAGNGTVEFLDGPSPITISGASTFWNFISTSTTGKELQFEAGATQTVGNLLRLRGVCGTPLRIMSSNIGTPGYINLVPSGQQDIYAVEVRDHSATGEWLAPFPPGDICSIDAGNNSRWFQAVPPPSADLSIMKTALPDPVLVGQDLTYTLAVTNAGPSSASSVGVTDTLPTTVTWISTTTTLGTCSGTTTVTCTLGTMTSGQSATITIVVKPTAAAVPSISNTATVSSPTNDPTPGNNSSATTTTVNPSTEASADLVVTQTDFPDPVDVGLDMTYTVTVTNNGPDTAAVVTLKDTLPSNVMFVSATPSPGSCNAPSGGIFTCNLGSLTNGASATVQVVVTTTVAGMIANTAEVINLTESDPDLTNNSATETTNVGDVSRLINISTRAFVGTGLDRATGGFILGGNLPKGVLIRGFGPTLASFGITGALANPMLELFWDDDGDPSTPGIPVLSNDDWETQTCPDPLPAPVVSCGTPEEIRATGMSADSYAATNPNRHLDAALLLTLQPGTYTVRLSGVNNGTGVGLVGVDDVDPTTLPKLVNISTRGLVLTGTQRMVGGFIIGGGTGNKQVLIRGFGPTLSSFGIAGVLANPMLELFWDDDGNPSTPGIPVLSNDDWETQTCPDPLPAPVVSCGTPEEIRATGMSADSYAATNPNRHLDAALLLTLQPGTYTARLSGVSNGTGVGLFGVDEISP